MRTPGTSSHAGPIVVGIDGSDSAVRAAVWAAEEAARHNVALRLVHSYFQPYLYYPPFATSTTANSALFAHAHGYLRSAAEAVRAVQPGVDVHTAFRYGHPAGTLLDESSTARMVVLGARGQHGFDGLPLGSVAVSVSAHAHCPVAIVRGEVTDRSLPVVVGVDGSPVSEAAIGVAFDEASTRGTSLIAVHAWTDIPDQSTVTLLDSPGRLQRMEDDERRLLAERLAGWQEKYPDVTVESVVTRQRPAVALLGWAATAQLVVVGSHGRGGFAGMLIGSTSQALLHHSPCTVMVVRPNRS